MGSVIPSIYKGPGYGTIYGDSEIREAIAFAEVLQKLAAGSPSVFDDYKGPGYGTVYGDSELIPAIAIAEVMQVLGVGIGGGSGFTYDQETEPSDPDIGNTWKEVDGDGLIEGEWLWDGTQWVSIQVFTELLFNGDTSFGSPFVVYNSSQILILNFVVCVTSNNVGNNDASNYRTHNLTRKNNSAFSENTIASVTTETLTSGRFLTLSTSVNQVFSSATVDGFLIRTASTGSPNEVGQGSGLIIFRLVR